MLRATDWDAYYHKTPGYTQITRRLSAHKLVATLRPHLAQKTGLSICEPGGANSCFMDTIVQAFSVACYHVIDLNDYGLALLQQRKTPTTVTNEQMDIRAQTPSKALYDLVYSVGLIEHFDSEGTAQAIGGHFSRCKPGGIVLMTFPTPTLPYRLIRCIAERFGKWSFPDERPLTFLEVEATCAQYGTILHRSINWWIGLTQGYLVIRKHTSDYTQRHSL